MASLKLIAGWQELERIGKNWQDMSMGNQQVAASQLQFSEVPDHWAFQSQPYSTPAVPQQYSSRTPVCLMFTYIILYIYNVDLVYVFDRLWMRVELRSLSLQG